MTVSTPAMASQSVTTFSPLRIRSADTPPQTEKVITPGREPTREERKLARRRNGPISDSRDALPHYDGKRLKFTLPSAFDPKAVTQSQQSTLIIPSSGPPASTSELAASSALPDPAKQSPEAGPSTPQPTSSSIPRNSSTDQVLAKGRGVGEQDQVTNGARSRRLSSSRGHQISSRDLPTKPKGLRESVKGKEKASCVPESRTILKKVKRFWSAEMDHAGGPLEFASPSKLMISAKPSISQTANPLSSNRPDHSLSDSDSDFDSEPATRLIRLADRRAQKQTGSAPEDATSSQTHSRYAVKKQKMCLADESDDRTSNAEVSATPNTKHPVSVPGQPLDAPNGQPASDAVRAPGAVQAPSIKALPKKISTSCNDSAPLVGDESTKEHQLKHPKCSSFQPDMFQLSDTSQNLTSHLTRPKTAIPPAHKISKNPSGQLQPQIKPLGSASQPQPHPDHGSALPKTKKANHLNRSRKKADNDQTKENHDPGSFNSSRKRLAFAPSSTEQPSSCVPMHESAKLYNRMTNADDGKSSLGDSSSQGSSTSSGSRRGKQYQKASVCESRTEGASQASGNVPPTIHSTRSGFVSDGSASVPSTPQRAQITSSDEAQMKRLAARVFTPATARLLPEVSKKVAAPHQAVNHQPTNDQPAGCEEQLYIVADRYVCESESEEGEQTPESAKLVMKIKSQLNPPDIIWISIRKLIQDELARLDGPDSKDGAEREVLEGVYERFKTHMLEYAQELVKHGLMKLRLQKLVAEEKAMGERELGTAGSSVADSTSCGSLDQPPKRAGEPTQPAGGRKRTQTAAVTGEGTSKSGAEKKIGRPLGLAHSKGIRGNSKGKRAKKAK